MSKAFNYTASFKLDVENSDFSKIPSHLPGSATISFESRQFRSYDECATSCLALMGNIVVQSNTTDTRFILSTEVNPVFSGKETVSKDWDNEEISRVWVYDKNMEQSGQIHAVAQAKIFTIDFGEFPQVN